MEKRSILVLLTIETAGDRSIPFGLVSVGDKAMKVTRSMRREYDRLDAIATKAHNRVIKTKERLRRDARMVAIINSGGWPHPPQVLSWLSRKLNKPSSKITQAEAQALAS